MQFNSPDGKFHPPNGFSPVFPLRMERDGEKKEGDPFRMQII